MWLRRLQVAASALLLLVGAAQVAAADPERAERLDMVRTMEMIARESSGGATPTTLDTAVLEAMRRVPRHAFVPKLAYAKSAARKEYTVGLNLSQSGPDPTRSSMRSSDALRT